jgi:hypothetical protein
VSSFLFYLLTNSPSLFSYCVLYYRVLLIAKVAYAAIAGLVLRVSSFSKMQIERATLKFSPICFNKFCQKLTLVLFCTSKEQVCVV